VLNLLTSGALVRTNFSLQFVVRHIARVPGEGGWPTAHPGRLTPTKSPGNQLRQLDGSQCWFARVLGKKISLAPTGARIPNHSARSEL